MANAYKAIVSYNPSRRYTIPQLLHMAYDRRPFDLSKFSYDAARAGVVPPLGDCAMSSRRSSATRGRGWSSASYETSDDIVVFSGNTNGANMIKPDRQPMNPPVEPHQEKDAGFAKFLRKHSSPTHNRVTTGGRIVPMEKRDSPPKFSFPGAEDAAGASFPTFGQGFIHRQYTGAAKSNPEVLSSPMQGLNEQGNSTNKQDSGDRVCNIAGSLTSSIVPANGTDPSSLHALNGVSAAPGVFSNTVGMYPPQYGVGYFPAHPPYFAVQQHFSSGGYSWPTIGLYDPHGPGQVVGPLDTQAQILMDAEALYNNLDRQLKLIDRHRAMSTHDPTLSSQRMAIVQQRADARAQVDMLKAQLHATKSQPRTTGMLPPTSPLAPAFVPAKSTQVQYTASSPINVINGTTMASESFSKRSTMSKRKPIPIVPPPKPSPSKAEPCKTDRVDSTDEMHPAREESQFSSRFDDVGLSQTTASNAQSSSETSIPTRRELTDHRLERVIKENPKQAETSMEIPGQNSQCQPQTEWMCTRSSEPPLEVQSFYELQLDAMRLPKGITVSIPLGDGTVVKIPGSKVDKPSDSFLSDFERDYWDRKPIYTKQMLRILRAKGSFDGSHGVPSDDWLINNINGESTSPIKITSQNNAAVRGRIEEFVADQTKQLKSYAPLTHVSTQSELSVVLDLENRRHVPQPETDSNAHVAPSKMQAQTIVASEQMMHKGYSSVSVQNVTVQVQLPPPGFDGSGDQGLRSAAASSLAAAGKQRSPRLLHRSTPNGGA